MSVLKGLYFVSLVGLSFAAYSHASTYVQCNTDISKELDKQFSAAIVGKSLPLEVPTACSKMETQALVVKAVIGQ